MSNQRCATNSCLKPGRSAAGKCKLRRLNARITGSPSPLSSNEGDVRSLSVFTQRSRI
jgi:hypothetical protein